MELKSLRTELYTEFFGNPVYDKVTMKFNTVALPFILATVSANSLYGLEPRKLRSGCALSTLTKTSVYTVVATVCGGSSNVPEPPPKPTKPTPSLPPPGSCRTTTITTVSNKKTITTSVKLCPYPPFTIPITGEPSTPTPTPEEPSDTPSKKSTKPTPSLPPPGSCRTTTITTVSNKKTITTSVKLCPYPPFTIPITGEPPTPTPTPKEPSDTPSLPPPGSCRTTTITTVSNKKTITTPVKICPYPPFTIPITGEPPTPTPTPKEPSDTPSLPPPGSCRTTTITTVSNKKTITTSVKLCPYPPFTIPITGEPPTPTPTPEEPSDTPSLPPPGSCRTTTITTVSNKKTITTPVKICPYPPFTIPITGEPPTPTPTLKEPSDTPSLPPPGSCRTTTITTVSNKKTITTSVKICPYPPFTIPITGEPPTPTPTPKEPSDTPSLPPPGSCRTTTITTVSNKKTITTPVKICPYPPTTIPLTEEPPIITPKPKRPTPIGKGSACPPSKIQQVSLSCLKEQQVPCKTPCKELVTVTSTGACSCIGAKQQVTGTILGPTMCPSYCGCTTSTVWTLPAGCKTIKSEPPKPTVDEEEEGGGYGY
ncbi:uncharacterized protein DFL_000804 [Arthrobotrys flagrans]|uniref:Uncharacterized protein n=1 Tax=Arthrobotrys flagrans TaxID=97331 RepID=A0A437AET0_ARTFL|nr:hypothetical protein DFL_000804 [Arthrobotrys flagrans]